MAVIGGDVNCSLTKVLILIALTILNVNVKSTNAAWFEDCNHQYKIQSNGSFHISSPLFPKNYPSGSSCRYTITAPENHQIIVDCNIDIHRQGKGTDCSTDYFYIATDADVELHGADYFCGHGNVRRQSFANKVVLAYISSTYDYSGQFACRVHAVPRKCECGWTSPVNMRIANGVKAKAHEYPFYAGLLTPRYPFIYCGATIISHHYVLTAAHCVAKFDVNSITVVVGEHDVRTADETRYTRYHKINRMIIHERFNSLLNKNDIALLRTTQPIEWTPGVGPVCLPFLYSSAKLVGVQGEVMGWGSTFFAGPTAKVLMKAQVKMISNDECRRAFPNITSADVCHFSPPKDTCQYDSGGPIVIRHQRQFMMGIITFGEPCPSNIPSPNLRISSYLDWIVANTKENFCRQKILD